MIVDLFAGPGGWDEGVRQTGRTDVVGIEWDQTACRTAVAAGHRRIRADVTTFPLGHLVGRVEGLIASPPCPDFSAAGKRAGINGASGHLILQVPRWVKGVRPLWVACEQVPEVLPYWDVFAADFRHELGYKTWTGVLCAADYGVPQERYRAFLLAHAERQPEPPAKTHDEHPQAPLFGPTLLPWVSMAQGLGWGATGRPCPTVTSGGTRTGGAEPIARGGRDALEREREREIIGYRRTRGTGMTDRHGERPDTPADRPAPTITSKARTDVILRGGASANATMRSADQPAPTLLANIGKNNGWEWVVNTRQRSLKGGKRTEDYKRDASRPAPTLTAQANGFWQWERPATTVCGDPRITARCHHDEGTQGRNAKTTEQVQAGDYEGTEPIKLTVEEALILQGFDPAYPVQGSRTKKFEQIGNAVPPPFAAAVFAALVTP